MAVNHDPPPEGQRYLRQAFERYHRARSAPDACERGELMLLGNLEIGFHEQTRLQPEIAEAVDVALPEPEQLSGRLVATLFPAGGVLVRARLVLRRLLGGPTPLDQRPSIPRGIAVCLSGQEPWGVKRGCGTRTISGVESD